MIDVKEPAEGESNSHEQRRFEELRRLGYSPKRALYIAMGSPYGKNRKAMKRWLRENGRKAFDGRSFVL